MGEKENGKREKPRILGATDLVHLNSRQRLGMLGNENWRSRREFLKTLLGAAAVVALPLSLVAGCTKPKKKKPVPACACEADTTCTCEADTPCTCETDTPCTCETDTPCTCEADTPCTCETDTPCTCEADTPCTCEADTPCTCEADTPCACEADAVVGLPTVVSTTPADAATVAAFATMTIEFSEPIDQATIDSAVTFDPVDAAVMDYNWLSATTVELTLAEMWQDGTTYTGTIAGTVADLDGNPLDGNADGTGGDPYTFSFTISGGACACQADAGCACQADAGCPLDTGCPFDLGCILDFPCMIV